MPPDAVQKYHLLRLLVTNDQSEFSLCPTQRNSFDNELNSHGKRLLEICKGADLRILNGRVSGDSLGRVTFRGKNGVSVVDYAVIILTMIFYHTLQIL